MNEPTEIILDLRCLTCQNKIEATNAKFTTSCGYWFCESCFPGNKDQICPTENCTSRIGDWNHLIQLEQLVENEKLKERVINNEQLIQKLTLELQNKTESLQKSKMNEIALKDQVFVTKKNENKIVKKNKEILKKNKSLNKLVDDLKKKNSQFFLVNEKNKILEENNKILMKQLKTHLNEYDDNGNDSIESSSGTSMGSQKKKKKKKKSNSQNSQNSQKSDIPVIKRVKKRRKINESDEFSDDSLDLDDILGDLDVKSDMKLRKRSKIDFESNENDNSIEDEDEEDEEDDVDVKFVINVINENSFVSKSEKLMELYAEIVDENGIVDAKKFREKSVGERDLDFEEEFIDIKRWNSSVNVREFPFILFPGARTLHDLYRKRMGMKRKLCLDEIEEVNRIRGKVRGFRKGEKFLIFSYSVKEIEKLENVETLIGDSFDSIRLLGGGSGWKKRKKKKSSTSNEYVRKKKRKTGEGEEDYIVINGNGIGKENEVFCPQNHKMKLTGVFEGEYASCKGYHCDFDCTDDDILRHGKRYNCIECDYDICVECINRFRDTINLAKCNCGKFIGRSVNGRRKKFYVCEDCNERKETFNNDYSVTFCEDVSCEKVYCMKCAIKRSPLHTGKNVFFLDVPEEYSDVSLNEKIVEQGHSNVTNANSVNELHKNTQLHLIENFENFDPFGSL